MKRFVWQTNSIQPRYEVFHRLTKVEIGEQSRVEEGYRPVNAKIIKGKFVAIK